MMNALNHRSMKLKLFRHNVSFDIMAVSSLKGLYYKKELQ